MAILFNLDDKPGWREWLAERPQVIKDAVRRWPPNRLYLMDSGHRATISCYSETDHGVRVMMDVTGEFNLIDFPRRVFDVDPATLTECALPEPGEPLGVMLTPAEADAKIAKLRAEYLRERGH